MARKQRAKLIEPRQAVNPKDLELETAKEILAETFGVLLWEVEETIQLRCEERERWQ